MFEHLTGLQLSREREPVAKAALRERIESIGSLTVQGYLKKLQATPSISHPEWDVLIEKVVIGETRFFRYDATFDFITRFLNERLSRTETELKVRAWSVGCSTGEEVYSLAMLLHRLTGSRTREVPFSVLGTDINSVSLKKAAQGIYRNIQGRGVGEEMASKFFDRQENGAFQAKDVLRSKVAFFRHNMLEPVTSTLIPPMDLISCQNVLMYFQPWRRRKVIRNLVSCLKPDGVLVLCPGDLANWKPDMLERVPVADVQAYRRRY